MLVWQPPVTMTREVLRIERQDLRREGIRPHVCHVLVVDRSVVGHLLPHQASDVVRDRTVAVVGKAAGYTRLQVAVLPGAGTSNQASRRVVATCLAGLG